MIAYEFENVSADVVKRLERKAALPQGSRLLEVTQHRLREKETLAAGGLPVTPFRAVRSRRRRAGSQRTGPARRAEDGRRRLRRQGTAGARCRARKIWLPPGSELSRRRQRAPGSGSSSSLSSGNFPSSRPAVLPAGRRPRSRRRRTFTGQHFASVHRAGPHRRRRCGRRSRAAGGVDRGTAGRCRADRGGDVLVGRTANCT